MKTRDEKFFVKTIVKWAEAGNIRSFPWRETSDTWCIALAEILLVRTPALRVLPVYLRLVKEYPLPSSVSTKELPNLVSILEPLGLQNKKAIQIKVLSEVLRRRRSRKAIMEGLKEVPGIGVYTYNAILLFGFKVVKPLVDGNVGRIFSRYFGLKLKGKAVSDSNAWNLARKLIPKRVNKAINYSYGLIDFGNEVCKRKPNCAVCPLRNNCKFFKKAY